LHDGIFILTITQILEHNSISTSSGNASQVLASGTSSMPARFLRSGLVINRGKKSLRVLFFPYPLKCCSRDYRCKVSVLLYSGEQSMCNFKPYSDCEHQENLQLSEGHSCKSRYNSCSLNSDSLI